MTIFEGMLVAHAIGDWLLQTEWQARNKISNWRALAVHILVYHLVLFAVLWFGFSVHNWTTVLAVMGLAVTHVVLDRRTFVHWLIRSLRLSTQTPLEPWFCIVIDQVLHLILLGIAAVIITT